MVVVQTDVEEVVVVHHKATHVRVKVAQEKVSQTMKKVVVVQETESVERWTIATTTKTRPRNN